jgi:hypothetical protein
MRARAAYIRSLGTTSILVAASLLMLGVVGALVGFHGWPEGAVGETVPSVALKPAPQPVLSAVRTVRKAPEVTRVVKARANSRTAGTAGLVKVVPVSSPQPIGLPVGFEPGHVAPNSDTPPPPAAAHHEPAPTAPVPPGSPAPPDVGQIQALLTQLAGPVPPPPAGGTQVDVPLVGLAITVPPVPAR